MSFQTATSIYGPSPSVMLNVNMPIPGTANAPVFDGRQVRDFLEIVKLHADAAGRSHDSIVDYIYQYSTEEVRDTIRYLPEFDRSITTGRTWTAAADRLKELYGATDVPPEVTEEDLCRFCRRQAARPSFRSKAEVDAYNRNFHKIAASLVKKQMLTEKQRDYYFTQGISNEWKEWFLERLPEVNQRKSNPPSIKSSMSILYKHFDTDALFYEAHGDEEDDKEESKENRKVRFSETTSTAVLRPSSPNKKSLFPPANEDSNSVIDALTKQLEQLSLNQAKMTAMFEKGGGFRTVPIAGTTRQHAKCFICGEVDAHPLHPSRCPETPILIQENLITIDPNRQRYVLLDGSDLPQVPNFPGGVAAYLRQQKLNENTNTNVKALGSSRDVPPHMNSLRTNAIGLSYGKSGLFEGNVFAVTSLGPLYAEANLALRSGKDTTVRFDPVAGKDDRTKKRDPSSMDADKRTKTPPLTATKPKNTEITPPANPINRQDGWKASLPSSSKEKKAEDVPMKDDTKKGQYKFTSDIQEQTNIGQLYEALMSTQVSVPIKHIIGASPALQKLLGETTRSRREYYSRGATVQTDKSFLSDYDAFEAREEDQRIYDAFRLETEKMEMGEALCAGNVDRMPEFMLRCSNAVLKVPTQKFFAMVTGGLEVTCNGESVVCMIDTGSELNLVGGDIPDKTRLPIDFEGMRWSLKGIHGGPEQLAGVVPDAPFRIGGHDFPHHVFVSKQSLGTHDVILGQPFLQWYAARIDYTREGVVKMFLWKDGARDRRPTIVITLTDPQDPRNMTAIRRCQTARIDEVEEGSEEDF